MREIKFMWWCYLEEKMTGPWTLENILRNDGEWHSDLEGVFLQYTGLKDKNGKEIYEGFIIEMEGWEPKRNIVGFANGGFGFKNSMSDYYHSDISYVETSRGNAATVIGNIYENPDLLK